MLLFLNGGCLNKKTKLTCQGIHTWKEYFVTDCGTSICCKLYCMHGKKSAQYFAWMQGMPSYKNVHAIIPARLNLAKKKSMKSYVNLCF